MQISLGICRFHPGSVQSGSTWQLLHLALPLKSSSPRAAAAGLKLPGGGCGAGIRELIVLAENLYRAGLELFFDEWEIGPGDVQVHRLDEGILTSRHGILVVSPESLSRPWVQQEYAAMMTRAVAGKQNLTPVLYKDAEMPPFMAARVWVDFRNADGPNYDMRVAELVRALKGKHRGPPERSGELQPRPDSAFKAAGTRALRLSIGTERVTLSGDGTDAAGSLPQPASNGGSTAHVGMLARFGVPPGMPTAKSNSR
jgi:TIR domain